MNLKKALNKLSFLLVTLGVFIMIIQPMSITGAVVDLSTLVSRIWFFIGFGMMGIGIGLFLTTQRRTGTGDFYTQKSLEEIMEKHGSGEDSVFVLDSSGAINYKNDIEKLLEKYNGRVYAPKRVMEELEKDHILRHKLKNSNLKQIDPKEDPTKYKTLRKLAIKHLGNSKKHQDYLNLIRIIRDEKVPEGISNQKLKHYENLIENNIYSRLRGKKIPVNRENAIALLKKEYKVHKGDVDVLTTALFNASNKHNTQILAHDTHIRDAVKEILESYPKLSPFLSYIEYKDYVR